MANVARKLTHDEPSYEIATIALVDERELVVRTARGERRARRAASCLVAPAAGDEVALLTGDGRAFVIAVLERANEGPVELAVEGDLSIKAGGALSFVSKAFNLRAVEGSVALSKLTVLATSVLAHSDSVRFAAKALESFCDHVAQTAKVWQRTVDELDQLRTRHADYRAEKEMCIRAENYIVGAKNLVKLDGEQVHLG